MQQPNGYKYWAFISYSHQDNARTRASGRADCVQWADWLHGQLETYHVPPAFLQRLTPTGEPMPERFFPSFRDEAELPVSADLGTSIRGALEASRFLIVICSPRSAASVYVNEEVRIFTELGRFNRILALIVDGEPNVSVHSKPGFDPAMEWPWSASARR